MVGTDAATVALATAMLGAVAAGKRHLGKRVVRGQRMVILAHPLANSGREGRCTRVPTIAKVRQLWACTRIVMSWIPIR